MNHPRVVHNKKNNFDIYIGRPSYWGNPYGTTSESKAKYLVKTRHEAIHNYAEYINTKDDIEKELPKLKDKILGCWCSPNLPCHGNILAELVDDLQHPEGCQKEHLIETDDFINDLNSYIIQLRTEGIQYIPIYTVGTAQYHKDILSYAEFINRRYNDINVILYKHINNNNREYIVVKRK